MNTVFSPECLNIFLFILQSLIPWSFNIFKINYSILRNFSNVFEYGFKFSLPHRAAHDEVINSLRTANESRKYSGFSKWTVIETLHIFFI